MISNGNSLYSITVTYSGFTLISFAIENLNSSEIKNALAVQARLTTKVTFTSLYNCVCIALLETTNYFKTRVSAAVIARES